MTSLLKGRKTQTNKQAWEVDTLTTKPSRPDMQSMSNVTFMLVQPFHVKMTVTRDGSTD